MTSLSHSTRVLSLALILIASIGSISFVVNASHDRQAQLGRPRGANTVSHASEGRSEDSKSGDRLKESYGRLSLSFEANQGQTDSRVKFVSRNNGYNLFLTSNESVFAFQRRDRHEDADKSPSLPFSPRSSTALSMKLAGANRQPRVSGVDELPGKSNYLTGSDPKKWRRNVSTYERVKYEEVYPGIDLVYYGSQRQLEYDFIVSPGADASRIKLDFKGADQMWIDANGDLILELAGEEIRQLAPKAYQEIDGVRRSVACRFRAAA